MTSAYAVIFFIALFGNSFGLYAVLKKTSSTNITNIFIANMAVADLLLTLTVMPFSVAFFFRHMLWFGGIVGNITCKAVFYAIYISISATVLTMMMISLNRFYAIFYPLKLNIFGSPKVLSGIIWILSFVFMLPCAFLYQAKFYPSENAYLCVQLWTWEDPNDLTLALTYRVLKIFHICIFVIMYALPLVLTITIYILICRKLMRRKIPGNLTESSRAVADKSKRKVVQLLVIICVVFALCWFPTYVNHFFVYIQPDQEHMLPSEVRYFFSWIAHSNSAINPCLYILLNRRFRKALFTIFPASSCLELFLRRSTVTVQTPPRGNPAPQGWIGGQRLEVIQLTHHDKESNNNGSKRCCVH